MLKRSWKLVAGSFGRDAGCGNYGESINGLGGRDTIDAAALSAGAIRLTVDGGAANDTIFGGKGDDLLLGGDGNDFLDGNQGNDTALLGAGNDVFQ